MPKDESVTFEIGNRLMVVPVANIISRMREDFEDRYGTASDQDSADDCPHLIQNMDDGICMNCGRDFNGF